MSSAGQAVGGVVGAIVGFYAGGNVALGASIGMALGGYIDPPKGANIIGPRLSDRKVQVASYGYQLPRLYGTIEVAGCVFWVEGDALAEHENKQKQGGKGGSRATNTTFTYSATFGVALAHCTTRAKAGVRRIKIAGQLVYDAGSNDIDSIIASNLQNSGAWKFYDGRDDQEPDPRMQADKGINNVSGHPGLCWLAIYDLDLTEKYSNSLAAAQVQVEIVCEESGVAVSPLLQVNADSSTPDRKLNNALFSQSAAQYSVMQRDPWNGNITNVDFYNAVFGESHDLSQSTATGIGPTTICRPIPVCQSGDVCALLQTCPAVPFDTYSLLTLYGKTGGILSSAAQPVADFPIYKDKTAAIDGDDWFIASREGMEIYKFHQANRMLKTTLTYAVQSLGLSESFIFGLKFESTSTSTITIYKFDRATLALLDTWIDSGDAKKATINVVSDTTLYTAIEGGSVLKWVSGSIVDDLGAAVSTTFNNNALDLSGWFSVFSESPAYVVSTSTNLALNDYVYIGHAANARTPIKLRDLVTEECAPAGLNSTKLDLTGLVNSDVRGYSVTGTGAVRGGLEPLQAAFPFDVVQPGYKVKFISRGGAPVANIPESDLGAYAAGSDPAVLLIDAREMSEQLPDSTTVLYLDADREYDNGEQTMQQPGSTGVSERRLELALVMTADEAAQCADVLNKKERAERNLLAFSLPPTWRHLEPADVVTINHRSRAVDCRLTNIEYLPDGRLECRAVPTSVAAFSSTATGSPATVLENLTVPLRGTTKAVLLDIPRIVSAQDAPGITAALYGQASGWPGGILMRSDDGGQTWPSMTGFSSRSEVFTALDVLASGRCDIIDAASSVTVTPNWDAADLFSISESQMLAGGNLAAFGADGRWEILAFKTVISNSGSYTLRDLMRGRYGTEWAAALHQAGDQLVMLNTNDADFIGLPLAALNSSRLWRAVTNNADINSAADIAHVYSGVNLKPLAPVYVNGDRNPSTLDWSISWIYRSRINVEPFSGLNTPLSEAAEIYDLEIWDSGYTTLKRSFYGLTSSVATYTKAQQLTDFGGYAQTLYLKIYQVSQTVGRGSPSVVSITRSVLSDGTNYSPSILSLSPLLYYKLDGSTTTIADSGSAASNATASATGFTYQQPGLLSGNTGYSILCAAPGLITSPRLAVMDGAYSATLICKPESLSSNRGLYHKGNAAAGGQQGHYLYLSTDGRLLITLFNGSWFGKQTSVPVIAVGEKAVFVFVYDGATTFKVYKNGVLFESLTLSAAIVNNTTSLFISANYAGGVSSPFVGYIDEFAWFTYNLTAAQVANLYEAS